MNPAPRTKPHERAHLLAAAGLLHDTGKVGEPAGAPLHDTIIRLSHSICPHDACWRPQYIHVVYSAQLLHEAEEQDCRFGGLDRSELFKVVAYHHQNSETLDQCLLRKADWLASGHDRSEAPPEDRRAGVVTGLWPILRSLRWSDEPGPSAPEFLEIMATRTLSFDQDAVLPRPPQDRGAYGEACLKIWEELLSAIGGRYWDAGDCIQRLEAIVRRTLHAVPASRQYGQQADVSLSEHCRITAAFAACLALLHPPDGPTAQLREPNRIEGRYRLLNLGVGRIQEFILRSVPPLDEALGETAERGMARRLRARSFYVSLLTWLAARRVLAAAGLPVVNLLFDGGGRSMLLLPDEQATIARVQDALQYLDQWLAERLGGTLRLDIALSDPLADEDLNRERFSATFRQVDQQLGEARWRLPAGGLGDNTGWNERGWTGTEANLPADRGGFLKDMENLGRNLPKANFLTLDGSDHHRLGPVLEIFGYQVRLHSAQPPVPTDCFALRLREDQHPATPLWLASGHVPQATAEDMARITAGVGRRDRPPEETAQEHGEVLTFTDLALLAEDEAGRPLGHDMLGALKADVDRLGMLLGYGLGRAVSFSRYASVARTLDQFFKGFLQEQLRSRYRHIYTVFTGGDDLFLIGPWYDLARLAQDLHDWFGRLTCHNPDVTFSAGLVFSRPATPVRHLAWLAEQALEKAKDAGRDRITVGCNTLAWSQYEDALQLHRLMRSLAASGSGARPALTSSLVYRLLQYALMARRGLRPNEQEATCRRRCRQDGKLMARRRLRPNEQPKLTDLKWRAQMSYDLKRNLPAPDSADSPLGRLHRALMAIRSVDDAGVLHTAATLTLYFMRGVER